MTQLYDKLKDGVRTMPSKLICGLDSVLGDFSRVRRREDEMLRYHPMTKVEKFVSGYTRKNFQETPIINTENSISHLVDS